jgi:hypothetical protein
LRGRLVREEAKRKSCEREDEERKVKGGDELTNEREEEGVVLLKRCKGLDLTTGRGTERAGCRTTVEGGGGDT